MWGWHWNLLLLASCSLYSKVIVFAPYPHCFWTCVAVYIVVVEGRRVVNSLPTFLLTGEILSFSWWLLFTQRTPITEAVTFRLLGVRGETSPWQLPLPASLFFSYPIDADSAHGAPALQRDWRSVWSVYFTVDQGKGAALGEELGCSDLSCMQLGYS